MSLADLPDMAKKAKPGDPAYNDKSGCEPAALVEESIELVHKPQMAPDVGDTTLEMVYANDEDMKTLRRVSGKLPWTAYTVAFVELCERFSYYGTTAVFVNFIQRPLPKHSTTGALPPGTDRSNGVPGALGMGQRASTALTTFNQFWSYVLPLAGAFVADQYLGRFNTINASIAVAIVGHTILIVSAIPQVISSSGGAIACFSVGVVTMGIGTGGFKPNISPLIAEQYRDDRPYIRVLPSGERVVVDPIATVSRVFLYFYLMINIGAMAGQICMVYAERYVGFWLSFLLPTVMFLLCPLVLILCRRHYTLVPPAGSVYAKAVRLYVFAMKGRWSWNPIKLFEKSSSAPDTWDRVKPSRLGLLKPSWMSFDDEWVDEVHRGLHACKIFIWYPLFWLAYNQMNNNLTSLAATMRLGGVPNDIVNNLNPIALIIFIPIFDQLVYPGLRRLGFNFTPIKRITAGFFVASLSMIITTVLQYYIYHHGPCGKQANKCLKEGEYTNISVWVQTPIYVLGGVSEILAAITGLEYAFTKAPRNMRSLVSAVNCFTSAISAAIGQAFVSLSEDPLLEWNYGIVAILAFIGGVGFWLANRHLDQDEDVLNMLPRSHYGRGENGEKGREDDMKA